MIDYREEEEVFGSQPSRHPVKMDAGGPLSLPSGNDPRVLPEIGGWNWGAFSFSWLWLSCMKVEYGLALLASQALLFFFSSGLFGFLGILLAVLSSLYLGFKGNEVAWRYRRFKDVAQFRKTMRAWNLLFWVLFGLSLLGAASASLFFYQFFRSWFGT